MISPVCLISRVLWVAPPLHMIRNLPHMMMNLSWNSNKLQSLKAGRTVVLKLITDPRHNNAPCVEYHTIIYIQLQPSEERYQGHLDQDEEEEGGSQEVQEETDL